MIPNGINTRLNNALNILQCLFCKIESGTNESFDGVTVMNDEH